MQRAIILSFSWPSIVHLIFFLYSLFINIYYVFIFYLFLKLIKGIIVYTIYNKFTYINFNQSILSTVATIRFSALNTSISI